MNRKERGELLLAVRIRSNKWLILGWAAIAAYVAITIVELTIVRKPNFSFIALIFPILAYVLHPRVRFFEGGVEIPPTENYNRLRFLRWDQIERYSWDGDRLILAGTQAVLSGGPVDGDTLLISPAKRPAVEQLLTQKMAH
jgi:hypothetical protein